MTSRDGRTFGHISGVEVGATFPTKVAVAESGVHVQRQAGIHGDQELGAFSICLSKGYEDNVDNGTIITYVGSGGQDDYGNQISDQSPDSSANKALFVSFETKRPVRVVRGVNDDSAYSPKKGYRYDGLYVVDEAKMKDGKKGFKMCTFKLKRLEEEGQKGIPIRRTLTGSKLAKIRKQARSG
ncbi:SRA-YDG [Suillus clintonianus]|uniref:SRA-YDG n=1 Tax=Suillus clintonianus TaxID=1904413 RepID=UPI001B873681|nr:SRA-YDG [Suillus clintonianus]KAG2147696.1 SRA-YDG [Suillus clintonianus]